MDGRIFTDRVEAGRALAEELEGFAGRDDVIVHALPRGGVPVAFEIAQQLGAPLDVMVVRKVGVPGQEELAMGAVASGGVLVRNADLVGRLGIGEATIERLAAGKREEVRERERRFRGDRETPPVPGTTVIVVDDGIATGSTMRAALRALRALGPARIVVAVPVAPREVIDGVRELADEVRCLDTPAPFISVGTWYRDFPQVSDDEVRRLLDEAATATMATNHTVIRGCGVDHVQRAPSAQGSHAR